MGWQKKTSNNMEDKIKVTKVEYLLGFLFLVLCNFTSADAIPGKTYILGAISLFYIVRNRKRLKVNKVLICVLSYVLIGCLQYRYYGYFNKRAIVEIPLLLLSGYFIVNYLGKKFPFVYFNLLFYLSAISLFFFGVMVLTGFVPNLPIFAKDSYHSICIYSIRDNEISDLRNCGPFWEPGAFGGYLVCIGIMFFNRLDWLWKTYKKKCIVILITIFTTFSTQTYVCLFLLIVFFVLRRTSGAKLFWGIFLSVVISVAAYTSLDFLGEKIESQLKLTKNIDDDSLRSANRFTTFVVEWSIFSKSPFIGNTNDLALLYKDYPFISWVVEETGSYGSGSGISTNLAVYGMFPFLIWLFFLFKNLKGRMDVKSALMCVCVLLFLGIGEQYSDQILYISLPFIVI